MPMPPDTKLDHIVAEARHSTAQRDTTYREHVLKVYPRVCGRCSRKFACASLQELTILHSNHNQSGNPPDGSKWGLLCVCCENEHSLQIDKAGVSVVDAEDTAGSTASSSLAGVKSLLWKRSPGDE